MLDMKPIIFLSLVMLSLTAKAKWLCAIKIANPKLEYIANKDLNTRLKKHQQLKTVEIELSSLDFSKQGQLETKIYFYTYEGKKFEAIYKSLGKSVAIWKLDFSRSQIFPELAKSYLNIVEFNARFYVRLYDQVMGDSLINLHLDKSECFELK